MVNVRYKARSARRTWCWQPILLLFPLPISYSLPPECLRPSKRCLTTKYFQLW